VLWPQQGSVATPAAVAYDRILGRLERLPNVENAGMVTSLPVSNFQIAVTSGFSIPGYLAPTPKDPPKVRMQAVSPGYFRALDIALVKGRFISEGDVAGTQIAGVINREFAGRFFHGVDPIGKQIVLDKDAE